MKTCIVIILFIHFLATNAKFTWKNCAPEDAILHVNNVEVGPDPIVVPGDITLTMDGNSTAPLGSSALHISLKRKTFLGEIPIPCISNIGSCTYKDLCTLVGQMIRENWLGITTGIATQIQTMLANSGIDASQCPQPAQSLRIDHQSIHLPEVPAALSYFAAGDYHAHIFLTDNTSNKVHLCIDAFFTIAEKEPCTGILCIFG
ncbi:uncharacterized protein LOC123557962 [Mercenaria mercenaria]|uniref:uncharacterized protein LOC123557962 n=1 Tax=Mercenaria mercenaria TaxID=6596 RepID=UPI00234E5F4E|nr:uncharacterized protein LOC123557962 [Mercenaria mercenaria]